MSKNEQRFCFTCDKYVEPEYVSHSCIAPYGSIVTAKGYCPDCGRQITKEVIVDDDGLHPPKDCVRTSRYGW